MTAIYTQTKSVCERNSLFKILIECFILTTMHSHKYMNNKVVNEKEIQHQRDLTLSLLL